MNINDDAEMAAFGRYCAKQKLIRTAKESIRDIAVTITNTNDADAINNLAEGFQKHVNDLVQALQIETTAKE